jgi:hypothetical protein
MLLEFISAKAPSEESTLVSDGLDFDQVCTRNFSWGEFHITKFSKK